MWVFLWIGAGIVAFTLFARKLNATVKEGVGVTNKEILSSYKEKATLYGTKYGVPTPIILAIIQQESSGNPLAQGPTNDVGLMQLTQPALDDWNRRNGLNWPLDSLIDADRNIRVGTWYLSWLYSKLGDWPLSIKAYNVGIGTVKKDNTAGQHYFASVESYRKFYEYELG